MRSSSWPRTDGSDGSDGVDGGNFHRHVQIDTSRLIGDSVGNMSISPTSRDLVLAARRGLYIIDLQDPEALPRFLAQGGTWDCADVQWHRSRGELIVSTSSEKLLIWNLLLSGRSSIEHVLQAHYRSITDINWSPRVPDMVASTGLDSWVWLWDMRSVARPALGLCAFEAGGTQVKWSHRNDHVLASSHGTEVFIWDTRKGSLPVSRIAAHAARVYGVDWRQEKPDELITCSLDKTIKVWDTSVAREYPASAHGQESPVPSQLYRRSNEDVSDAKQTIHLPYPVWRARDLPFGAGLLSLPQRSENALEMYAYDNFKMGPVEKFEGHEDTVKEFVWRRGSADSGEFQLITLSKDRTLRFWPIEDDQMQKVGHQRPSPSETAVVPAKTVSYRNPPEATLAGSTSGMVSIPLGPNMAIMDQVRVPRTHSALFGVVPKRPSHVAISKHPLTPRRKDPHSSTAMTMSSVPARHGGTMTRGPSTATGKSLQLDQFQWLKSITREDKREGSRSGTESGPNSRMASRSRAASRDPEWKHHRRESGSGSRDVREDDGAQTLQEEIKRALTVLAPYRVRLEKLDAKRRTCTITMHGPWGAAASSTFVRVAFDFPRNYLSDPDLVPAFDIDRSPLISSSSRMQMIQGMEELLSERGGSRLQASLSFLRFGTRHSQRSPSPESSDTEDDEEVFAEKVKKDNAARTIKQNKNLGEPRTIQGVFSPNGQLVCFFRAPPRIVRNVISELNSSTSSRHDAQPQANDAAPPINVADALERLTVAARDRALPTIANTQPDGGDNILRIMTTLLAYPTPERSLVSRTPMVSTRAEDDAYHLLSIRRSVVSVRDASGMLGLDREMAAHTTYEADGGAPEICRQNAAAAQALGRLQQRRVFTIFESITKLGANGRMTTLATKTLSKLYNALLEIRDLQTLALVSILLLHLRPPTPGKQDRRPSPPQLKAVRSMDYFSRQRTTSQQNVHRDLSPGWPRLPSATPSPTATPPTASTTISGRGSWSSLFNANSVRQRHDSHPEKATVHQPSNSPTGIPVPAKPRAHRMSDAGPGAPRLPFPAAMKANVPTSNSWQARISPQRTPVSFSSAGHGRRGAVHRRENVSVKEKKIVMVKMDDPPGSDDESGLHDASHLARYSQHVHAYADVLYSWELYAKRAELLKAWHKLMAPEPSEDVLTESVIVNYDVADSRRPSVKSTVKPPCSVCRIPIKR